MWSFLTPKDLAPEPPKPVRVTLTVNPFATATLTTTQWNTIVDRLRQSDHPYLAALIAGALDHTPKPAPADPDALTDLEWWYVRSALSSKRDQCTKKGMQASAAEYDRMLQKVFRISTHPAK